MDKPISVGDLVMYTRSCCDGFRDGINIFRVGSIHDAHWGRAICTGCKKELPPTIYAAREPSESGAPLSWLKRIPPLSELGDKEEFSRLVDDMQRKLKEPA
jgi:hypothetical protein